jgi:hypothetical protein
MTRAQRARMETEADDCPHCEADPGTHRVFVAGLIMLCNACLSEVPPAPASTWGPPVRRGRTPTPITPAQHR